MFVHPRPDVCFRPNADIVAAGLVIYPEHMLGRFALVATVVVTLPLLVACEPERGVRATRDFAHEADVACIESALQKHFPDVSRNDYSNLGHGTFRTDTPVTQFTYHRSGDGRGVSWVEVGDMEEGTRIALSFTGIGMELPQEDFPEALAKMRQANAALATECRLDLGSAELKEIGQQVDALNR